MKPTILKHEKNEMILEFDEIDQGFLNAINDAVWQQKGVEQAGFRVDHPEASKPVFIIKSSSEPKKIWNSALDALAEQFEAFAKELKQ